MPPEDQQPKNELTAAQWSALLHSLSQQAEHALRWMRKGTANTEDTVMSTLRTYLRQANLGKLPLPTDPESLWPVLQKQLERKIDAAKATQSYKKNRMAVRYSELTPRLDGSAVESFFTSRNTSPEQVEAYIAQSMRLLTDTIKDEELLQIARMKLECYSLDEIAGATGLSGHQVRRRLSKIKAALEKSEVGDA